MSDHFLFKAGEWLGAGQVTFSMSPDLLYFRAKWSIAPQDEETFQCTQAIEIIGGDQMVNIFFVMLSPDEDAFEIVLHNELLGIFDGTGVIEHNLVAWEFRHTGVFEGYEVYEKQDDEYAMHAEYLASDGARTRIRGKIWKAIEKKDEL